MASAQATVCPVVGTTTTVVSTTLTCLGNNAELTFQLPPNHPSYDTSNTELRCPVTNAKVGHHDSSIIHNHPSSPTVPKDPKEAMDAKSCPALKNANTKESVTDATCPVVGPVSAYLPPTHPKVGEESAGKVCPVTNATLEHHKDKVQEHPSVPEDAPVQKCPVAGSMLKA